MGVTVSIIIPVYNKSEYLTRCAEAIRSQTFGDFEAVFVNDGSTDGSLVICEEISLDDPRFTVVSQKNAGVAAARNTGISRAAGKYITFIDPDDEPEPDFLRGLVSQAEETGAQITCCGYTVIRNGEVMNTFIPPEDDDRRDILTALIVESPHYNNMWTKLYLREFITANEITVPNGVIIGEDAVFNIRAYSKAHIISAVQKPLYRYYLNEGSAMDTENGRSNRLEFLRLRCAAAHELNLLDDTCEELARQISEAGGSVHAILGRVRLENKFLQFEINTGIYTPVRKASALFRRAAAKIKRILVK